MDVSDGKSARVVCMLYYYIGSMVITMSTVIINVNTKGLIV